MQLSESINWYGCFTLAKREIYRFLKVYNQTIIAPSISASIMLLIFILVLGNQQYNINTIPFIDFISYGLIAMSMIQNAFSNSSSSIIMSKIIGYIHDILMPPLSGIEITIALCIGSIARAILIGITLTIILSPFITLRVNHPYTLITFIILSSCIMGILGIIVGIIAKSFDHYSGITSYLITPLSFLSCTFYSINKLPKIFQLINHCNPFFYMIDGFRYSITNVADSNIVTGIIYLTCINITLFYIAILILNHGWKIKG